MNPGFSPTNQMDQQDVGLIGYILNRLCLGERCRMALSALSVHYASSRWGTLRTTDAQLFVGAYREAANLTA
jgi:hypothetical protein